MYVLTYVLSFLFKIINDWKKKEIKKADRTFNVG